jgi:hypothetical protein
MKSREFCFSKEGAAVISKNCLGCQVFVCKDLASRFNYRNNGLADLGPMTFR